MSNHTVRGTAGGIELYTAAASAAAVVGTAVDHSSMALYHGGSPCIGVVLESVSTFSIVAADDGVERTP